MLRKTRNAQHHYKHWIIKAPVGLATIGFGVCLVSEAAMVKYSEPTNYYGWIVFGTIALIVLNTGVCLVGDAVKHRTHYDRLQERTEKPD